MSFPFQKRDCEIRMRLVPYGGGWTDVHLDIGGDSLYLIISYALGDTFTDLMRVLYFLHPDNKDPEWDPLECWEGRVENGEVVEIAERIESPDCTVRFIPRRGEFTWDEEGRTSHWVIERLPTLDTDFSIRISIDRGDRQYAYTVRYRDFCYAVAKACTETLKSHGIYGYHYSVYQDDMHLRYLLFIKGVALDSLDARALTDMGEGNGESTSLQRELELLLFDM